MITSKNTRQLYDQYTSLLQKIADIKYSIALLQWDQETYMPVKGASFRARQTATLSEMAHELFTTMECGQMLEELNSREDLSPTEKKNIELSLYDYNKQKKLSSAFVRELSEAISQSFQAWIAARQKNDFSVFEKPLNTLITLKKKEAAQLGYEAHPYDALLNEYERGCTVAMLDNTFDGIRQPLKNILDAIKGRPQVNDDFLHRHFIRQQQWEFGLELIKQLGFDNEAGRQDISEHPFTTNFSSKDVRITTRIDEQDFSNMTWSCIHEVGHALYEQGLPEEQYGLPLGEYASLSIHESQSRLWENNVGRSRVFWEHYFPLLQQVFPQQLSDFSVEDFYKGINKVEPSFIRTEADEITYHFHVMIRYELEKKLMENTLSAKDIPAYWNEQYEKYLGVKVPDDKKGCLQDVHWSHGSFGYFPTYSLGSFYAAQLFQTAGKQLKSLDTDIRNGQSGALLAWLRKEVHQYGRQFTSEELCEKICGEPLNIDYFMQYALNKYRNIYNF